MEDHVHLRQSMEISGKQWKSVETNGNLWNQWKPIEIYGNLTKSKEIKRNL